MCNYTILYSSKAKEFYAMGGNSCGQLGTQNCTDQPLPVKIKNHFCSQRILQISCGLFHTVVLTEGGLFSYGSNEYGQLGDCTFNNRLQPVNITENFKGDTPVLVACGQYWTLVATNNNNLFAFGYNRYGQLGFSSTATSYCRPNCISTGFFGNLKKEQITSMSCGYGHSLVLMGQSVFAFGFNESGQLGTGARDNCAAPQLIRAGSASARITAVRCGAHHSLIWAGESKLYAFGNNDFGQLGDGTREMRASPVDISAAFSGQRILQVNCGLCHNLVLTNKCLYSFGQNNFGQLGNGTKQMQPLPSQASASPDSSQICQIECLGNHNFMATSEGLYSFGSNQLGQLGIPQSDLQDVATPVKVDGAQFR